MVRRWFAPFAAQTATGRAWALSLLLAYICWAALLLAIPFGLDDRLDRADLPALAAVVGVGAPLLAVAGMLVALRAVPADAPPPARPALLAYNLTATATVAGFLWLTATPTDLHKLYAPALLAGLLVNALALAWGRWAADLWSAWGALLLAGALTVGGAWAGLRAPLDVQTTVRDVPITLAAPEGRLLNTCRPVIWDAGVPKPWDAFVRVGLDGATRHRTLDSGAITVCPYRANNAPGDPRRVVLDVPVTDGETEIHREWLDLRVVAVWEVRLLVVLGVVTMLLPPVALVGGMWATGRRR